MSLYAIIMSSPKPKLTASIKAACPTHYTVHKGLVVVKASTSAKQLYDSLPIADDERSGIIVIQVSADYYGLANKAFWDWLASTFREDRGG